MLRASAILLLMTACDIQPPVVDLGGDAETLCEAGAQLCNGPVLNICRPDGTGYDELTCDLGCSRNACRSRSECPPNSAQCIDAQLLGECDANGLVAYTVCDQACMNGQCVAQLCAPGHRFCNEQGNKVLLCDANGLNITEIEVCVFGCDYAAGQCKANVCETGETRCGGAQGLTIEVCAEGQTAFEPTGQSCTPPDSCSNGECISTFCKPGAKRCAGDGVEQCVESGSTYIPIESCEWGCLGNTAGDAMCALCLPGTTRCYGSEVQFCDLPYQPWQTLKVCNAIETCYKSDCLKMVTLTDAVTSDKNRLLLTASLADCWIEMAAETGQEEEVCRSINTVELSADIPKDVLSDWFCDGHDTGTINAENLGSQAHLDAAYEIMGCGITNFMDLTVDTIGKKITAGLYQGECIGYEPDEVIVKPCGDF